jgi:hypothetical protein
MFCFFGGTVKLFQGTRLSSNARKFLQIWVWGEEVQTLLIWGMRNGLDWISVPVISYSRSLSSTPQRVRQLVRQRFELYPPTQSPHE